MSSSSRRRADTLSTPANASSPPSLPSSSTKMQSGSYKQEVWMASAPAVTKPITRPRTKTLPSNATNPFSASDLKAKLLGIQSTFTSSGKHSRRTSEERTGPQSLPLAFHASPVPPEPSSPIPRMLRPQRSFHRPRTADHEQPLPPPPMPLDSNVKLGRSVTSASRRADPHSSFEYNTSLDRSRSTRTAPSSRRPSTDLRPSEDSPQRRPPPMPPLPSSEVVHTISAPPPVLRQVWHQRVFVENAQTYRQLEVAAETTAGDVLRVLEKQGMLPLAAVGSGWMLWEVCHDFGMGASLFFFWFDFWERVVLMMGFLCV